MSGGSTQDLKERVARLEAILGVQRDVAAVQKSLNEKSS